MRPWLILPFRSIAGGKRRLEPYLDQPTRQALSRSLLERALALAGRFPGLDRTLLVSHCPEALDRARALGASTLADAGIGHTQAAALAHEALRSENRVPFVVLSCDVPLANEEDVRRLTAADEVVLATDRSGTGTNALGIPPGVDFCFHFGIGSRQLHEREAEKRGLRIRVLNSERLAFDIDTPSDYEEWRRIRHAG